MRRQSTAGEWGRVLLNPSCQQHIIIDNCIRRDLNQLKTATGHPARFLFFFGECGYFPLYSVAYFDSNKFQFTQIHVFGDFSAPVEPQIVKGGFCVALGENKAIWFSTEIKLRVENQFANSAIRTVLTNSPGLNVSIV